MNCKRQKGFSLLETMVALGVLSVVGAIVMTGMVQMMKTQGTIGNRTEMHTSVRSATELLQQEIGQAGRLSLGSSAGGVVLSAAVTGGVSAASFTLNYPSGAQAPDLYQNEVLVVDQGSAAQETVTLGSGSSGASGSAVFQSPHPANAPVAALGAFATGVVPPDASALTDTVNGQCVPTSVLVGSTSVNYVGFSNPGPGTGIGSTCTTLKLYGDINGDGKLVYVEYNCAWGTQSQPGYLYRQQFYDGDAKTTPAPKDILLSNVLQNPPDQNSNPVPCFRYQVKPLGTGWVVTDVAVTLTVQTQNLDPVQHQYQKETKALLNVSPRNIFEVYDTANLTDPTRAQLMPAWVSSLL